MTGLTVASHMTIFNQLQPVGMIKMVAVSITKEYPLFLHAYNGTRVRPNSWTSVVHGYNIIALLFLSSHDRDKYAIFMSWIKLSKVMRYLAVFPAKPRQDRSRTHNLNVV